MRVKDALGRFGEDVAARHLSAAGLVILDRNWRCADGEIDIVAQDGRSIVFCEVKTRSSTTFGLPSEAVTPIKARRIRGLALTWLVEHRGESSAYWPLLRFDVISVLRRYGEPPLVDHLPDAF